MWRAAARYTDEVPSSRRHCRRQTSAFARWWFTVASALIGSVWAYSTVMWSRAAFGWMAVYVADGELGFVRSTVGREPPEYYVASETLLPGDARWGPPLSVQRSYSTIERTTITAVLLWPPFLLLLGVAALLWGKHAYGFFARRTRLRRGYCPHCRYNRSGLAADAPCPECGAHPWRPSHSQFPQQAGRAQSL